MVYDGTVKTVPYIFLKGKKEEKFGKN